MNCIAVIQPENGDVVKIDYRAGEPNDLIVQFRREATQNQYLWCKLIKREDGNIIDSYASVQCNPYDITTLSVTNHVICPQCGSDDHIGFYVTYKEYGQLRDIHCAECINCGEII